MRFLWSGRNCAAAPLGPEVASPCETPTSAACRPRCILSYASLHTATLAGRSASGSKRSGQPEGEQHTAPSAHPKRTSRWVVEEAAEEDGDGQAQRDQEASPSAAVGAPGDAVSDAEQPSGGSAQDSGKAAGDESPRRPVCVCYILHG